MHLKSVQIKRFKRVEDAAFDLADVNVFIGANNSGKSTLIQAMHFAFALLQSLEIANKWPVKTKKATTFSPAELIYIPSQDPYSLGSGGKLPEDKNKAISFELIFSDGSQMSLSIRKGRITNIIVEPDNIDVAKARASLEHPFSIFSPGLAGVSRTEGLVSNGVLLRALARGDANVMLRNLLFRLNQDEVKWEKFENDLVDLFPGTKLHIKFNEEIDEYIDVNAIINGQKIPLDLSGTGLLQAVQILSYYHLFLPKMIVLDEPDSHLHPNNQRLLCSLLYRLSVEQKVQILLTTHSRHVSEALSPLATIHWVEQGKVRHATPDDEVEVLLSIGALDITEKLAASSYKLVFLTEDATTYYITKVLSSNGFDLSNVLILPYYGVTNTHNLSPIVRHIKESSRARIVVHRDRDYLSDDEAADWEKNVRALGADPFVTKERDVEGYFCRLDYLERTCVGLSRDELSAALDQALEELKPQILADAMNGRMDIERKNGTSGKVNVGKLSADLSAQVQKTPSKLVKGKMLLARLRGILNDTYGESLSAKQDKALADETLSAISQKTFPKKS